jgi:bacterioferritin (cytochrome b1)
MSKSRRERLDRRRERKAKMQKKEEVRQANAVFARALLNEEMPSFRAQAVLSEGMDVASRLEHLVS